MKWIKVEDKLPEEGMLVLVFSPRSQDKIQSGKYEGQLEELNDDDTWILKPMWNDASCCSCRIDNVTHWMPLPNPPQE